jgi:hypothetical protein
MKQIRPLINGLLACGIAFAMVTTLAAQTQEGSAKVVNISGSARYMPAGATSWEPLKIGAILMQGAVVQTAGSGSYVDVVLNNRSATSGFGSSLVPVKAGSRSVQQNAIRIFENTVLGFDTLNVDQTGADTVTETQLDLKAGKIFGTVKKLSAASKYEVKIPNGVAGIRGTVYYISADGIIQVISGSVLVSFQGPSGPVVQEVGEGMQFDVRSPNTPPSAIENPMVYATEITTPTPIVFTLDHTIYTVSPTTSSSGGGYNGGYYDTVAAR